jgi:hypothetical protein
MSIIIIIITIIVIVIKVIIVILVPNHGHHPPSSQSYLGSDGFARATVDGIEGHLFLELCEAVELIIHSSPLVLAPVLEFLDLVLVVIALIHILRVQLIQLSLTAKRGEERRNRL